MIALETPSTTTFGVEPYQAEVLAQLCGALAGIGPMPGAVAPAGLEMGLHEISTLAATAQSGTGLPPGEWTASFTPLPQVGRSLLVMAGPQDQLHLQLDSSGMPFVGTWQGAAGFLSFCVEGTVLRVLAPFEGSIPIGPVASWTSVPQFISQGDESAGGLGAGALFAVGGLLAAAAGALLARKHAAPPAPVAGPSSSPSDQGRSQPRFCCGCGAPCSEAAKFCGACGKPL